jgi:hypothetical protein
MQKEEVEMCFQGIQATGRHQATMMLKEAGVEALEEEWERAKCTVRHRRGARPPMAAVTLRVKPNDPLHKILMDRQTVGQDTIAVWVCRDEEQLSCVTTLVQDPEVNGYFLRSWTNLYELLGVSDGNPRDQVVGPSASQETMQKWR